jgi:hypothetical protein
VIDPASARRNIPSLNDPQTRLRRGRTRQHEIRGEELIFHHDSD